MLLAPERKTLSAPYPKRGNRLEKLNSLTFAKNKTTVLISKIGTRIRFTPEIAFKPNLLESTAGIRNNISKKAIGVEV